MSDDGDGPAELFGKLKDTPVEKLRSIVGDVDGLTEEQAERLDRGGDQALRAAKRKLTRWTWYTIFCVGLVVAVIVVIGIGVLGYIFIVDVVQNDRISDVIAGLLSFVFGVAFTLAVEFLWRIGTGKE